MVHRYYVKVGIEFDIDELDFPDISEGYSSDDIVRQYLAEEMAGCSFAYFVDEIEFDGAYD